MVVYNYETVVQKCLLNMLLLIKNEYLMALLLLLSRFSCVRLCATP